MFPIFYALKYAVTFFLLWSCVLAQGQEEGYNYVASKNSQVYHELSCQWAQKIAPGNRVYFRTIEEAEASNRRPCKVCSAEKAQPVSEGTAAKTESRAEPRTQGQPVTMSGRAWWDIAICIIVVVSISSVTVLFLYLWKSRRAHERSQHKG